jgi:hypothetical protein
MRKSLTAVFLALAPVAALTTLAPTAPVYAQQAEVSVSLFYDKLSEHGKWVEHPRWGWVWYPSDVDPDWRPYTRGRWVWTQEYGWYWASEEPFGWAVYHYGRWGYDDQYGWVWVPGDRWAASWVAFRYSDRAVGWAPLPPETLHVSGSVQVDESIITANYYQPRWVFVEARAFVEPRLHTRIVPVERNVAFIRETRNVTNITLQNKVFVNRSFEPQRIRTVVGRDIPTVRVNRVADVNRLDIRQRTETNINQINIYNPQVRIERDRQPPERARARESDRPRVTVRPEFVRPEERRDRATPGDRDRDRDRDRGDRPGERDRTAPGAPPSDRDRTQPGDRDRTTPPSQTQPGQPDRDRRGAQPDDRDRTTPGQPDRDRRGAQPGDQERRDRTAPGAPPGRQGTQPDQERRDRTTPGAPPGRQGTQPDREGQTPRGQQDDRRGDRPGQTPPRTQEDRRGATPATPATPPERGQQQQERRGATPATPAQPPSRTQEDRRGATPATPAQPPSRGQQQEERRGATPATPAKPPSTAPGAPPSRQTQPQQQQQPQRGQQQRQQPGKADEKKSDEKKEGPSR